jgi:hypothetical protein
MPQPLLPARFLFRFSAPCRRRESLWTAEGAQLDETYRLAGLTELEGRPAWADVRAAWNAGGLVFSVRVSGKKRKEAEQDDGLHLWIDTRDVHDIHRAGRFCHRFRFRPVGGTSELKVEAGGGRAEEWLIPKTKSRSPRHSPLAPPPSPFPIPSSALREKGDSPHLCEAPGGPFRQMGTVPFFPAVAEWLPINRAREQPRPIAAELLQAVWQPRDDGYILDALLPAEALTGFDPAEHTRLGFTYAVVDRELGEQTFGVGSPMPYQEDPSLWATLELVG